MSGGAGVGATSVLGGVAVETLGCFDDGVGVPTFVDVGVPTIVDVDVAADVLPLAMVLPKHTDLSTAAACEDKPDNYE